MKVSCAECGCVVEQGVRVVPCGKRLLPAPAAGLSGRGHQPPTGAGAREQAVDRFGDRLGQRGPGEPGPGDAQADDAVQLLPDQLGGEERLLVGRLGADAAGHQADQLPERRDAGELLGRRIRGDRQRVGEHHLVVARVRQPELAVRQAPGPDLLARIRAPLPRLVLEPVQLAEAAGRHRQDQRVDVGEVQVDRGRGDAHLAGHRAQRQRRGGRVGQQAAGGLDDVVAEPLALAAGVPPPGRTLSPRARRPLLGGPVLGGPVLGGALGDVALSRGTLLRGHLVGGHLRPPFPPRRGRQVRPDRLKTTSVALRLNFFGRTT